MSLLFLNICELFEQLSSTGISRAANRAFKNGLNDIRVSLDVEKSLLWLFSPACLLRNGQIECLHCGHISSNAW